LRVVPINPLLFNPLLISDAMAIGIPVVVVMFAMAFLLLRNRQRCPKDRSPLRLVAPETGHHMVFRCPRCGYHRRTKVPLGRR
jgi:hypothetical protein